MANDYKHKDIGEKLRQARVSRHYNQTEAAQILGIKRTAYAAYEEGRVRIPPEIGRIFATEFGISFLSLYGESEVSVTIPREESELQTIVNMLRQSQEKVLETANAAIALMEKAANSYVSLERIEALETNSFAFQGFVFEELERIGEDSAEKIDARWGSTMPRVVAKKIGHTQKSVSKRDS